MNTYTVGTSITLRAVFTSAATGALTDPQLVLGYVLDPQGVPKTIPVQRVSVGVWQMIYTPAMVGLYFYRFYGSGGLQGANEGRFAAQSVFPGGLSYPGYAVPPSGALSATGFSPVSSATVVIINPPSASLSAAPQTPVRVQRDTITPFSTYFGGISLLMPGYAPSLGGSYILQPGNGTANIAGNPAFTGLPLVPATGAIGATSISPGLLYSYLMRPFAGSLLESTSGSTLFYGYTLPAAAGALALVGTQAALAVTLLRVPASGALAALGVTGSAGLKINPLSGGLSATVYSPTVSYTTTTQNTTLSPQPGILIESGVIVGISYTILTNTATLRMSRSTFVDVPVSGAFGLFAAAASITVTGPSDIIPPTVSSLVSTNTNVTVAGSITLTATATDNVGVVSVQFLDGTTILGNGTSVGGNQWTFQISFTAGNNGTHTYTAKAYDAANNVGTSSPVVVTVNISTGALPPDIYSFIGYEYNAGYQPPPMSSPVNSTKLLALHLIARGDVNQSSNIDHALVYDGSTLLGRMAFLSAGGGGYALFTYGLLLATTNNGTRSYTAQVFNTNGAQATSSPFVLTVNIPGATDVTPPVISAVTSSATFVQNGSPTISAPGTITLTVTATDNVGVTSVVFYDGATQLGSGTSQSAGSGALWSFTTPSYTSANNGVHAFTATAYDAAGNSVTSSVYNIVVAIPADVTAPVMNSLTPSSTNVTSAGTFTLTANATDNIGVTSVSFYDGTVFIGKGTSVGGNNWVYTVTATGANNGSHVYIAKAFDAAGNVASSSASTVTINISTGTSIQTSMTQQGTSIPAITYPQLPPAVPQPAFVGDIVGFNVQNTNATIPTGGTYASFGQVFKQGDLQSTDRLVSRIAGVNYLTQTDVLSTWPDGSVRHAKITLPVNISANSQIQGMLAKFAGSNPAAIALTSPSLTVGLQFSNSIFFGTQTIDIGSALTTALAGTPSYWVQGALRTEARVDVPVSAAMHAYGLISLPEPNVSVGDTLSFQGTTVTFVASGATGNQVNIGSNLPATGQNLLTFLRASSDPNISQFVYSLSAGPDQVKLYPIAVVSGTAGNALSISASHALVTPMANGSNSSAPTALHITANIAKFSDGTYLADVQFNNDLATSIASGPGSPCFPLLEYTATVNFNSLSPTKFVQQMQYSDWHWIVTSGSAVTNSFAFNVQWDLAYVQHTGMVPPIDRTTGVSSAFMATVDALGTLDNNYGGGQTPYLGFGTTYNPTFGAPLSTNNVIFDMGTSGDRGDIGWIPSITAGWLGTQDPVARQYVLLQGDTAGAIPWNYKMPSGRWLNAIDYPNFSLSNYSGQQAVTNVGDYTAWKPDTAHTPELSYMPYLMTGDQWYYDRVMVQASWPAMTMNSGYRFYNGYPGIVINFLDQVRQQAWSMRGIQNGAICARPGLWEINYFPNQVDQNYIWLNAATTGTGLLSVSQQGQAAGWLVGTYGYFYPAVVSASFMQNYFTGTAALAAMRGHSGAKTFLAYQKTYWLTGLMNVPATLGQNPYDATDYNLHMTAADGTPALTWAAIDAATLIGQGSNTTNWTNGADYEKLYRSAIGMVLTVFPGDAGLTQAWNFFNNFSPPPTQCDQVSLSNDPKYNNAPLQ